MKRIIRMFVFSAVSIYVTSLWDKGFIVNLNPATFVKATFLVGFVFYLITPLFRILLLPLNIVTFGLASTIAYVALFYFIITKFSIIQINDWIFPGLQFFWLKIPVIQLNSWTNLIVSSFSISTIINLLESLL